MPICIFKCTFKCMKYISTTDLRTRSAELVEDLKAGYAVTLIHRSEVVGVIEPTKEESKKSSLQATRTFLEKAGTGEKLSPQVREKRYRDHLEENYGRHLS